MLPGPVALQISLLGMLSLELIDAMPYKKHMVPTIAGQISICV